MLWYFRWFSLSLCGNFTTIRRLTNYYLSASRGPTKGTLQCSEHDGNIVPKGLRMAINGAPLMPRGGCLSDSRQRNFPKKKMTQRSLLGVGWFGAIRRTGFWFPFHFSEYDSAVMESLKPLKYDSAYNLLFILNECWQFLFDDAANGISFGSFSKINYP